MPDRTNLCSDPTCTAFACTQEAIDAWLERQQREARTIVRAALGLPVDGAPE